MEVLEMNEVLLEWIGYIASLIVLISLLMSSIKKLRWINLVGALIFGIYGFMIHSLPTGLMNIGIVVIDMYFLARIYFSKEYFTILEIDDGSHYLKSFIEFYKEDLDSFFSTGEIKPDESEIKLYILRNMTPAGVFICDKFDNETLEIRLDYAIPQYRDFKLGTYIFESQKEFFTSKGYTKFVAHGETVKHTKYLLKMGFKETTIQNQKVFVKELK